MMLKLLSVPSGQPCLLRTGAVFYFLSLAFPLPSSDTKYKLSGMRSRMAFLRHLIIYGYIYDVDYKELHGYNVNLSAQGTA